MPNFNKMQMSRFYHSGKSTTRLLSEDITIALLKKRFLNSKDFKTNAEEMRPNETHGRWMRNFNNITALEINSTLALLASMRHMAVNQPLVSFIRKNRL